VAGRGRGGKSGGRRGASRGGNAPRQLHTKVKTARGRKRSSTLWLQRQLNDPYVAQAKADGYRARAAYKLTELDDKFKFLKRGRRVIDLGAAPGSWSQVAVERVRATETGGGSVTAVDILDMDGMTGVGVLKLDMREPDAPKKLIEAAGGKADVVLSDMAPSTTGHGPTDHIRIVALVEIALDIAVNVLNPGGTFVAKVFKGGAEGDLLAALKQSFETVKHAKPGASRKESAETYVVATGFKGPSINEEEVVENE